MQMQVFYKNSVTEVKRHCRVFKLMGSFQFYISMFIEKLISLIFHVIVGMPPWAVVCQGLMLLECSRLKPGRPHE